MAASVLRRFFVLWVFAIPVPYVALAPRRGYAYQDKAGDLTQ